MIGYAVLGGFVLDAVFGDPAWLPHPVDVRTLLHKPLCRQCLSAPEHLHCQSQQWVQGSGSHADKACDRKGAYRQTKG